MANSKLKRIRIARGNTSRLLASNDIPERGGPFYDTEKQYLYIGKDNSTPIKNYTDADAVKAYESYTAQYASSDTSKGTIEERLTRLGFSESTITNNDWVIGGQTLAQPYVLENSIKRQGNYVILRLNIPIMNETTAFQTFNLTYVGNKYQGIIGNLPTNYRPASKVTLNDVNLFCGIGPVYSWGDIELNTDGSIKVTNVSEGTIMGIQIYCGYEASPRV